MLKSRSKSIEYQFVDFEISKCPLLDLAHSGWQLEQFNVNTATVLGQSQYSGTQWHFSVA
jgi:hypothetical protein